MFFSYYQFWVSSSKEFKELMKSFQLIIVPHKGDALFFGTCSGGRMNQKSH